MMKSLLRLMLYMARAKNLLTIYIVVLQIMSLIRWVYFDSYGNQWHPTLFFAEWSATRLRWLIKNLSVW